MNIALIQLWENFDNGEHQSDGCSIHLDLNENETYLKNVHENELPVGLPTEISITDSIYSILEREKNIRLSEIEMNNLIGLKDIVTL